MKLYFISIILLLINACSFDNKSGIWTSDIEEKKKICDKLIGYRFVENLNELHKGKHVRWIRKSTNKLTNGGIIVDIKFLNNGIQILCKNSMNRFIQYKYDECITYQKMNEAEQLVVMAYEYASNVN